MKKLVSFITILAILLGITSISNATITEKNAKINVAVSKQTVAVGEEVTVTASWKDTMEAVDLELSFDKNLVEYVSSSMQEDYIATDRIKEGVVQISWFSMNGKGINQITYKFKALKEGSVNFKTAEATLADENVESPEAYTYGTAKLTVQKSATQTPSTDKPATQTPSTDKPATQSPSTSKPATQSTTTSKPATQATTSKPTTIPAAGLNIITIMIYAVIAVSAISLFVIVNKTLKKNK